MRRSVVVAAVAALAVASTAQARDRGNEEPDVAARIAAPLVVEASGYAGFQDDVAGLEGTPFASLDEIDTALEMVASHDPEELARAWMAYAALIAAQSPAFVDSVRQTADYYGRDSVVAGLRNDPAYAGQLNGSDIARQAVLASVSSDVMRIREVSAEVKQQAYSLQSNDWASAISGNADERIARLDAISVQPRGAASQDLLASLAAPGAVGSARLENSLDERENFFAAFRLGPTTAHAATPGSELPIVSVNANPQYKSVLDQVITLAAFEALDAANAGDEASLAPMLNEQSTQACMVMARSIFRQCIAASHFRYEDPFCIAEHGVKDVGDCFSKVMVQ